MNALWGLLRKETYHILRDRRTLAVLIFMPIVQVILFGFSIRTDVRDVRLAIVDPSPDAATLAIRDRFNASGVFRTVAVAARPPDLDASVQERHGASRRGVRARDSAGISRRDSRRALLVTTDATEPNSGTARQFYVDAVIQGYEAEQPRGAGMVQIVPQARSRFNPTRASTNLFVPGLMAMVLMIIAALMTALSLTREKETGTMEALLVSPLRPWQIIIGKVAPYLGIGFISVLTVLWWRASCSACRCKAASRCCSPKERCSSSWRSRWGFSSRRARRRSAWRCSAP